MIFTDNITFLKCVALMILHVFNSPHKEEVKDFGKTFLNIDCIVSNTL